MALPDRGASTAAPAMRVGRVIRLLLINVLLAVVLLELCLQGLAWINRYGHRVPGEFFGAPDTVRVLCLGDSNTYGLYLPDRNLAWCKQLEMQWNAQQPVRMQAINLGWPGTISARIASQIEPMMLQFQPDYVLLMVGVNDFWSSWLAVEKPNAVQRAWRWVQATSRIHRASLLLRARWQPDALELQAIPEAASADFNMDHFMQLSVAEAEQYFRPFIEKVLEPEGRFERRQDETWVVFHGKTASLTAFVGAFQSFPDEGDRYAVLETFVDTLGFRDRFFQHLEGEWLAVGGQTYRLGAYRRADVESNAGRSLSENLPYIQSVVQRHGSKLVLVGYPSQYDLYGRANTRSKATAEQHGIPWVETHRDLVPLCASDRCENYLYEDRHPRAAGHAWIAGQVMPLLAADRGLAKGR